MLYSIRRQQAPATGAPSPATVGLDEMSSPLSWAWVRVANDGAEAVLVTAKDDPGAEHTHDLWATVEEALERAEGRPVAIDLRTITAFDARSIDVLINLAKAAKRRHVDLCALVLAHTPLHDSIDDRRHTIGVLSMYSSLAKAMAVLEQPPAPRYSPAGYAEARNRTWR